MHPRLDRSSILFGNRQQLDRVAELARISDVIRSDAGNSLGVNLPRSQQATKRQGDQQAELVGRIVTLDVESRIGLGDSTLLRGRQGRLELNRALAHGGQN